MSEEVTAELLFGRERVIAYVTLPLGFGQLVLFIGDEEDPTTLTLTNDNDLLTVYR